MVSELIAAAADRAVPVVRGIKDTQLSASTPCREYDVRALVNHLYHVVVNFQALAARQTVDWTPIDFVAREGWRDSFATETRKLIEAWSKPDSLVGVSNGIGLPQETVARLVLLDLTVHAWDLATATGQAFEPAPEVVEPLHGLVEMMGPTARERKVFADPVPVPEDASRFDALLAGTGRDPLHPQYRG